MGFFSLLGRLALNTKPFDDSLDKSAKKAETFAGRMEKSVGKRLDSMFGAGLALNLLQPLQKVLFAAGDRAREIDEGSRRLSTTAENYQILEAAARDAGVPIETFAAIIKKQNSSLDEGIAKLTAYRNAVKLSGAEVAAKVSQMDEAEATKREMESTLVKVQTGLSDAVTVLVGSIASIFRDRKPEQEMEIANAWARIEGFWRPDIKPQKRLNKKEVDALLQEDAVPDKGQASRPWARHLTPHQQIGAYIGVPGDRIYQEQKNATAQLSRINQRLEQIHRELATRGINDPFR